MLQWDIGVCMFVGYDEDGYPIVQPDVFGEERSGTHPMELHHASGFFGMPHEPRLDPAGKLDPTGSNQVLYAWEGSQGHAIGLADVRVIDRLPKVVLGGSVHYGGRRARPAFSMFDGKTGSFQLYVPYAFSDDSDDAVPSKACTIGVNVRTPGAESVEIVHGSGCAVTMTEKGVVIKNKSGNAYIELNDDGIVLNGNVKVTGAFEYGGSPAPVPMLLAGMVPSTMGKGI